MKQFNIRNVISQQITHTARFATQEEGQSWVDKMGPTGAWGKPERWVSQMDLVSLGENPENAVDVNEVSGESGTFNMYKFASEFEVIVEDISAQLAEEADSSKDEIAEEFSKVILRKIRKVNRKKIRDGVWNTQKVRDLKANATMMALKEDIRDGFFGIALLDLNSSDVSEFYTSQEKMEILSLLQEAHSAST